MLRQEIISWLQAKSKSSFICRSRHICPTLGSCRTITIRVMVVEGRRGFDDLRRGQVVEYTLENGPYLRANSVRLSRAVPENVHRPAA